MLVTDESCGHWLSEIIKNPVLHIQWHVLMSAQSDLNQRGNVLTTGTLKIPLVTSLSFICSWAPESVALICFTSGTTGRPKGVKISHSALIVQSQAKINIVGYHGDDIYLHTAPLCHIGGLSSVMAMLMVGGCHVFLTKFEAKLTVDAIEEHSVTSLITVPAIMNDLISEIRMKEGWRCDNSLKKILNGGGSLSADLINDATKYFPQAKILSAYGMTETCSSLTFMTLYDPRLDDGEAKPTSVQQQEGVCVGKPAPCVELRIDVEKQSDVGRILTKGPHVMVGYWGLKLEGWFDTGDVGKIDDCGNLWLMGRADGRIKSGGENVYPEEVEAVLSQNPGISSSVVVGVPDARLTEMVVACCRLKDKWEWRDDPWAVTREMCLSSEILCRYCKEKNLTGYKVPRSFVVWRRPFPLTVNGKLRRNRVRSEVLTLLRSLPSSL